MSDRELLEAAAKAAGIDLEWIETISLNTKSVRVLPCIRNSGPQNKRLTDCREWNPLSDDADALRLAAKLDLQVGMMRDFHAEATGPNETAFCFEPCQNGTLDELLRCARRAIVRAAAEIGKLMT